ncbi:YesN/AraC family two-component response regulator [Evansella vedderi]|uniref:YesN/AraC family two-component response regulator n=1 Tax=Evansella vedderi TaxID=38282 RepID=A0ABT9ZQ68_9BACI|nr:helix-turn-helix domain-containing protein [Evansella vedderi]MDQ0253386.1 YesN/AraC family two-component response regulator [Evansella vedderi]
MGDILIIDDDIESCHSVRSIIEGSQFNHLSIYESNTAHRGLILLKQKQPAALLIDLSLPDHNGLDVGKQALELYPQIPIIVLTQLKMFESIQECINAGFSGYLLKPFSKSELLTILDRLLKKGVNPPNGNELLNNKILTENFKTDLGNPIKTAIKLIQSNYNETLNLHEIADSVYLSPSHFSRLFKEETGTTFVEYLTRYRVEKSKDMLKMTSLPIEVIANNIGFTSASYFATTFKRIEGKKPREYRRMFTEYGKKMKV